MMPNVVTIANYFNTQSDQNTTILFSSFPMELVMESQIEHNDWLWGEKKLF
jgi:hypothetical protein